MGWGPVGYPSPFSSQPSHVKPGSEPEVGRPEAAGSAPSVVQEVRAKYRPRAPLWERGGPGACCQGGDLFWPGGTYVSGGWRRAL